MTSPSLVALRKALLVLRVWAERGGRMSRFDVDEMRAGAGPLRFSFLACAGLASLLALAPRAGAEMPYPSNPTPCRSAAPDAPCIEATDFAQYLFLPTTEPPTRPDDFGDDNWKLTSDQTGDPLIDANPQELFGVKGASVDLAWQVTTGRPDVLIAVIDSGIRWQDQLPDVVDKFYLNRGELPVPEGSDTVGDPYDRNGDGVFNIRDYLADDRHEQDSRVQDENGNGVIDPEDLIFLFSDGNDDDGDGYVDDISGWDFFEDDNDALDEVRYGHGTGESHDSSAEANNGGGSPGTCPNCMLLEVRVGDSFVAAGEQLRPGGRLRRRQRRPRRPGGPRDAEPVALRPAGDRLRLPARRRGDRLGGRRGVEPPQLPGQLRSHGRGELGHALRRRQRDRADAALVPVSQRLHELRRAHRRRRAVVELLVGGDRAQRRDGRPDRLGGAQRRRSRRAGAVPARRRHGGAVSALGRGGQADPDRAPPTTSTSTRATTSSRRWRRTTRR